MRKHAFFDFAAPHDACGVDDAQRLERDDVRRALVSEIVEVGRRAGAFVIATGIESSEQISVAQELGVDAGEGLLLLMSASVPA